ncbi:MAG TPA: alanine--tRNA ligase-related protein, partial [Candidatus Paceibacterota bacterium]
MESREIREKFISFFEKKGHKIIPSSSLLPQDDPTTLFTGSGMQPLLPYFLGKKHPLGSRLVNSQKSFRAEDIEEVGDNRHTTFFEMLGNWSLGDYFKVEQIRWLFEFLIEEIKLDPKKLYVTVFSGDGDHNIPRDAESAAIWARLFEERGIEPKEVDLITEENGGELGMGEGRIFYYGVKKNWWSRKGAPIAMPAGEPGGPDSEVFYDFGREHNPEYGRNCHPNCGCGRFIEIGNSVFMEYVKEEEGSFKSLPQKNVDFGGGLERITAAANDNKNIFEIDTLRPLISEIKKLSEKGEGDKSIQIVADHLRSVAFLIADGALPSNIGQGYVARRLIRRAIRHSDV